MLEDQVLTGQGQKRNAEIRKQFLLTNAEVSTCACTPPKPCHQMGAPRGIPQTGSSHFPQQGCLCPFSIERTRPRISAQLAEGPWICPWFTITSWTLDEVSRGLLLSDAPIWIFSTSALGNEISSLQHSIILLGEFQTTVPVAEGWGFIIPKCYTCGSGLFCLNMLPDYFLTCIGLNHLIHSKSLKSGKKKKKDLDGRRYCKSRCCHKSISSLWLSPLPDTKGPSLCFWLPRILCGGARFRPTNPRRFADPLLPGQSWFILALANPLSVLCQQNSKFIHNKAAHLLIKRVMNLGGGTYLFIVASPLPSCVPLGNRSTSLGLVDVTGNGSYDANIIEKFRILKRQWEWKNPTVNVR